MTTIKEIEAKIKESNEVFDNDFAEFTSLFSEDPKDVRHETECLIHKMKDVQSELTSLHEDLHLAQMRELSRQDELED